MSLVFGKFETVRQLNQSGDETVWTARLATGGPADACVKVVVLDPRSVEEHDTIVAQQLLVSAALQQSMAEKSGRWAPVLELGSDGTNAFYARPLYARSVQSLVDEKAMVGADQIRAILLAIVDGLIDLENAYHRPHGNLKPTNVLIAGRNDVDGESVFLVDPDATADVVPSLTRAPDIKAVGQILYSLVTGKPHTGARFPLGESEKWKRLGSTGRQWFILCNRLLDTFSRQGLAGLEGVRSQIVSIEPAGRGVPKVLVAAAVLAAVAAGSYAERARLAPVVSQGRQRIAQLFHTEPRKPKAPLVAPTQPTTTATTKAIVAKPTPPELPPAVDDKAALRAVAAEAAPDFGSAAAAGAFTAGRGKFLADHAGSSPEQIRSDWAKIAEPLGTIPDAYAVVSADSVGNHPPLVAELTLQRDAALTAAVEAAFAGRPFDPGPYRAASDGAARLNDAAADVTAASTGKTELTAVDASVARFQTLLAATTDPTVAAFFDPIAQVAAAFKKARTETNRTAVQQIAAGADGPAIARLAAWRRLSTLGDRPWPGDVATVVFDRNLADTIAAEFPGNAKVTADVEAEKTARLDQFLARLTDATSAGDAAAAAGDPANAALLAVCPAWFRYDAALLAARGTPPTADGLKSLADLADAAAAAGGADLRAAAVVPVVAGPRSIETAGPMSVPGWTLSPGSNKQHRTYVGKSGASIEFLLVNEPAADGSHCYLATTAVPVSLLQRVAAGPVAAAMKTLDDGATETPGMHVWHFADGGVKLDDENYKRYWIHAPSTGLPAQDLTPAAAVLLARELGCRLPSSKEWRAALDAAAAPTADADAWGFAMLRWKLRDGGVNSAAGRLKATDPALPPPDARALGVAGGSGAWTAAALATLSGRIAPTANPNLPADFSVAIEADTLGFRDADDGGNFSGVFHDLIGNVAQIVADVPGADFETLKMDDDPAKSVREWVEQHGTGVFHAVGGSMLSPPSLDPLTPVAITGAASDAGLRLAFSDPAVAPPDPAAVRAAALGKMKLLTAPASGARHG